MFICRMCAERNNRSVCSRRRKMAVPFSVSIGAYALEYTHAVVQGMGQYVGRGLAPGHHLAIEPDDAVTIGHRRSSNFSLRVFRRCRDPVLSGAQRRAARRCDRSYSPISSCQTPRPAAARRSVTSSGTVVGCSCKVARCRRGAATYRRWSDPARPDLASRSSHARVSSRSNIVAPNRQLRVLGGPAQDRDIEP